MPSRVSLVFSLTTVPVANVRAVPRTGGWSEGHWVGGNFSVSDGRLAQLAVLRARMLPTSAAITGYKVQAYALAGNKLTPTGSSNGQLFAKNTLSYVTDIPQMALEFGAQGVSVPNSAHFNIAGIPDAMVTGGEYSPTDPFNTQVQNFQAFLAGPGAFGWVGRVLTNPTARVLSAAAGVVTLSGDVGGNVNQDFLRFHRVYDTNGVSISGSFLITNKGAGNTYTLQGFNGTITKVTGLARVDALMFIPYASVNAQRVKVRKVGRPTTGYRGRASKRT